ncbi:MAG: ribosomal-processing cysteine protease Prp [Firmicutes bacterium HGW-Firmicutes-2]|jgi:hypothetical protein|nr:MAG: ribosomal-processing cysteine protease Prp [Firmicutes bacterium HGW-Firmicutes-2]
MIDIILYKRKSGNVGFCVSGHAGFEEIGKDIVCASVSVLAINTVNAIKSFTDDRFSLQYDEDGKIDMLMKATMSPTSQVLLDTFELGMTSIYEEYGHDYINIKIEEV